MTWEKDFFEINLDRVQMPDIPPDWSESKGYKREQMQQWISNLKEVQRLKYQNNYKDSIFEHMRQCQDNPKLRALGETHNKFYGQNHNNHVKTEWVDGQYQINNGNHRVWLAKQSGLRHIPASVQARDFNTLSRLKAEGDRLTNQNPIRDRDSTPDRDRGNNRERV
jgi:hypothetical protein